MKLRLFTLTIITSLTGTLTSWGWGQKGHDTVAHIAERHLTKRAAAAVDSLLGGQSLVYWANWLDNASHTPEYDYSRTWHYKNIEADETFEKSFVNPKGDIISALTEQQTLLGSGAPNEALALKMVTHLMGDLHQPLHLGRYSDRGGNNHPVKFFERDTNLHSIWDTSVLEAGHKWSYSEWADQIDRASEALQNTLLQGDVQTWARETHELAKEIYASTPENTVVEYDYIARWTPTIEQQLLKGGLRLAHILNMAYDPDYNPEQ